MAMVPSTHDTIVAVSCALPATHAAHGLNRTILRLSGPQAFDILFQHFSTDDSDRFQKAIHTKAWKRMPGFVSWRDATLKGSAYLMPGPRSYTRQDVAELHLDAPSICVPDLLKAFVQSGTRLAMPGEFTRRALLNGRISVEQAEAIGALIRAESAAQARAVAKEVVSRKSGDRRQLREAIETLLALLELNLDFSQEDVDLLTPDELKTRLADLAQRARDLSRQDGAEGASGMLRGCAPHVVFYGATNAGKSSLFNALLKRQEAIVSQERNTTRDVLQAEFEVEPGLALLLMDTAGIAAEDGPETILCQSRQATHRVLGSADLLLFIVDQSDSCLHAREAELLSNDLNAVGAHAAYLIWSKADLKSDLEDSKRSSFSSRMAKRLAPCNFSEHRVSVLSGEGLPALTRNLAIDGRQIAQQTAAARSNQQTAVSTLAKDCLECLERAQSALLDGLTEDAIAVELREAVHILTQVDGHLLRHDALTESLLDRIFFQFCIGK